MKILKCTHLHLYRLSSLIWTILLICSFYSAKSVTYYSKPTGNLELTSSWTTSSNGLGGTSPNNFNAGNSLYIIANRATATIGGNWNIAATSTVQVGNGTTAVNFIIPSAASMTDIINVTNSATLTIQNNTNPILGFLAVGSTVNYALAGNQTVVDAAYYNLTISGSGRKALAGITNTSISNFLNINSGTRFRLANVNTVTCTISGTVTGTGGINGRTKANLSITGNGDIGTLTFTTTLTLNNFTVNRINSGLLTLGSNLTVNNIFSHTNGIINLNGKLLTLNGAITLPATATNGSFGGSATSSLSIAGAGTLVNSLKMNQASTSTKSMSSIILNRPASTLTIGNSLSVIDEITPTIGTIAASGNVTLTATSANKVGRVGTIGIGASITGNITAESYALGGKTGWTLLGAAGITGKTFADWNDDFAITCAACPQGSLVAGVPFTSIASYNEAAGGTYSNTARYVNITSISSAITPAKGYWVYLGNSTTTSTDILFDVTGPVNQGNKTINLSFTNAGGGTTADHGFNLISNPYPSPINWSALRATSTQSNSIANAIYVYNPDLSGYATCVAGISSPAVGSGGIGSMIPAGQGFYVKVTGAATLNASETIKAASTQLLLKSNQTQTPILNPTLIRIKADGANMHGETAIYFDANTHSYYEEEYDAISLAPDDGILDVTSLNNDTAYSINGLEALSGSVSIPIKITTGTTGTYQIYADDFTSIPSGACLILHDNITNTDHNLRTSPYTCSISNTETNSRFTLNITINNDINVIGNVINPSCIKLNNGYIIANASVSGTYDYFWKDEMNQIIKTSLNKSAADTLTNIGNGYYKVDISNSGTCSNGSQSFQLSTQLNTSAFFTPSTNNAVLVNDTVIVNFANNSVNADTFYWDFDNNDENTNMNPSTMFTQNGDYEVTLYAINSACGDTTAYTSVVHITGGSVTTGIKENSSPISKNILIDRDKEGYFVQFNFTEKTNAEISVWNLLGELVSENIFVKNAKDNKVYIPINTSNNLLIITVNAENGDKGYRKIIND